MGGIIWIVALMWFATLAVHNTYRLGLLFSETYNIVLLLLKSEKSAGKYKKLEVIDARNEPYYYLKCILSISYFFPYRFNYARNRRFLFEFFTPKGSFECKYKPLFREHIKQEVNLSDTEREILYFKSDPQTNILADRLKFSLIYSVLAICLRIFLLVILFALSDVIYYDFLN